MVDRLSASYGPNICVGDEKSLDYKQITKVALDVLSERGKPELLLLIGSVATRLGNPRDIDLVAVFPGSYERTCVGGHLDGRVVEICTMGKLAFNSIIDNYYWYPQNLVAEIGKITHSVVLYSNEGTDLLSTIGRIIDPTPEVRFFIVSFHLAEMSKATRQRNIISTEWSITSIVCALESYFPPTLDRELMLRVAPKKVQEALALYLNLDSNNESAVNEFIQYAVERSVEEFRELLESDDLPLYYFPNHYGHEIITANRTDISCSHHSFSKFRPR